MESNQSLAHVLNVCQKAPSLHRYSARHHVVLQVIMNFASQLLPEGMHITAGLLPGMQNSFTQDITTTTTTTSKVTSSSGPGTIHVPCGTVLFEANTDDVHWSQGRSTSTETSVILMHLYNRTHRLSSHLRLA